MGFRRRSFCRQPCGLSEICVEGWVALRTEARLTLPDTPAASRVAELLTVEVIVVGVEADFTTAAWRKLLVNALSGLMVLTGRRSAMFRRDDIATLARNYLAQWLEVARARVLGWRTMNRRHGRAFGGDTRQPHDVDADRPAG
jgi:2-dehydropantoate 2-reductase